MANVTLAPGYLPECTSLTADDFNPSRAATFDPRRATYYVNLLPSVVPALVFGCLAVVGLIFFLAWMCYQHRRAKRSTRFWKTEADAAAAAQTKFMSSAAAASTDLHNGSAADAAAAVPSPTNGGRVRAERRWRQWVSWDMFLRLCIVLMALALIGVSGWGLAQSIKSSNDTVDKFWDIIDLAEEKLVNASETLQVLDNQMGNISYALGVTSGVVQNVPSVIMLIPGVRDVVKTLQTAPVQAQATIDSLRVEVQGAIEAVNDTGLGTINDLRNNFYWWTNELQDTWRFVVIGVVFGLTILFAALTCVLVTWMGWPKTGSLVTALLWLVVAVLMLLGVGLLKGAYKVSGDACLYSESFAMRVVNESVTPESTRDTVLLAMNYYFGFYDIPDDMVVYELFGAPTYQIEDIVEGDLVQSILSILSSSSGVLTTILNAVGVSQQDTDTMFGLLDLVPETVQTVTEVDAMVNRANIDPVYHQAKQWVCCDLKHSIHELWEAWTVTGCLGWVLGALCSFRVILHTMQSWRIPSASRTVPPPATTPAGPQTPAPVIELVGGHDVEKAIPSATDMLHVKMAESPPLASGQQENGNQASKV